MPATDAIDAAALGKHSYMHCTILTEILNVCCLFYSVFLSQLQYFKLLYAYVTGQN